MIASPRCLIWCAVSSRAQNEPDKISLPQQEADLRALAQQHNWQVAEVMLVPGHSRRYIDFHELADDAAREGIDAFYRLKQHWEKRDFDILIVRDGERFARTQALHAYIAERTIAIGARIYSLQDGWIDEQNYRMWIAMAGYKAAGDIDRMVRSTRQAMTARAERGLPTSSRIPLSHRLIRDPKTGKGLYLEVNEDKRRLWNDLAELILEGVAWEKIELELYERFGHVNEDGEKYYANFMYRLVMKPVFWGHIARWHNNAQSKNGFKYGRWIYNDSESIPDGTLIFHNTHPPVWDGELGDRVKQELDRRSWYIRGKAVPAYTHRLSGLAVCGECGNFMSTFVSKGYRGLYCPATKGRTFYTPCNNRGVTNERQLIARMNEFLSQMLHENKTDIFAGNITHTKTEPDRISRLEAEISQLEEQGRSLIRMQRNAPENIQQLYAEELERISDQLKHMKETRNRLQGEVLATQQSTTMQQATLGELADLTLEKFWQQESRYINQVLHRIMGNRRLVILNRELIGVAEVHRKQRRHV